MHRFRPHARIAAAVLLTLLLTAACGTAQNGATQSPLPSPSVPGPSTTPDVTPSPTMTPDKTPVGIPPAEDIGYGLTATVTVDRLRVRTWPGRNQDVYTILENGDKVVLEIGPVDLEGYRWYSARFEPHHGVDVDADFDRGWIASGPSDDPTSFLDIGPAQCPTEVTLEVLGLMYSMGYIACNVSPTELSGIVDTCYEGPHAPITYQPDWAYFSCFVLREANANAYAIYFPPDYSGPEVKRGDVVTAQGHIGFDSAKYGACVATVDPEVQDDIQDAAQAAWEAECQYRFVVSSVDITDHVELPPVY